MTRLFLRFYFGVIVILFVAWIINSYVWRGIAPEANVEVIEDALSGGVYAVRDRLVSAGQDGIAAAMAKTETQFDYPVRLVSRADRPMTDAMSARLDDGDVVLYGNLIQAAMPESDILLELGPLPAFAGPTQADLMIGIGAVFVVTAIAIAILLRPVAMQLRAVERTALAISRGNLSARVNGARLTRNLPLAIAFNSMADRIETLLQSQKELLQAVSHELRTPLSRIKFATELLHTETDAAQHAKRIDAIDHATDQLDDLVGELLTYVRMDAGTESTHHESIPLDELVDELVETYSPLHPSVDFSADLQDPAIQAVVDRNDLHRAIGNLVSNAGKHAKSKVLIGVEQSDGELTITVDDDGSGIAEQDREIVFEPFKRLEGGSGSGSGLGLALVRRICRRNGGTVGLRESPMGGARFTIRLPVSQASES